MAVEWKGIDVSKHNGAVDFKKVAAAGYKFVIIRAGYGKTAAQKDPRFEANYKAAKDAGLYVGAYWYSYATTAAEAEQEAAACMEVIKGKSFEMPIYFDIEEKRQFNKGKDLCSDLVRVFCNAMERGGYWAGFYTFRAALQSYFTAAVRDRYALWVAEWGRKLNYSGNYGMWQNSDSGRVAGISGAVDTDLCYIDYPALIRANGLNGLTKEQPQPTEQPKQEQPKQPEYISYTIKKGDTLSGIAKKYGTTVKKLAALNGIKDPDKIYAGKKLKIPKV